MTVLHANLDLALRIEVMQANLKRTCVGIHRRLVPESKAEYINALGGAAVFIDETSPLTEVAAAGTVALASLPVTAEEALREVETFMEERGAPVVFKLCPFSDAALFTQLSRRGYEIGEFENVLVRPIVAEDAALANGDVVGPPTDLDWANGLAEGFFDMVTTMGTELGLVMAAYPNSQPVCIMAGSEVAAAATVTFDDDLALLACDATIRRYREAGAQKRMISHRLALAARQGCTMATAETLPGSISQMNYEKMGFRVAYTKMTLMRP